MKPGSGSFLRHNAFLVAAVALPVALVGVFLLATAIPRWTVPPPAYDLLMVAGGPYDQTLPRVTVSFAVRAGRVEATIRPLPATAPPLLSSLLLFDHVTSSVREIPITLPDDMTEGDPPRTIVVDSDALGGRQILAQPTAPDGYALETRRRHGPGIVGELFGMNRYDERPSLVNKGRVVPIVVPSSYRYHSPVSSLGWLVDQGQR